MLYKKKGTPESGEIVLCTVKKILPHSVFVSIDEYEIKEGMIHISEISPGRIRNLRDFVKEGKRIVCKVININKMGNIDLSLRRVGTGIMVNKINQIKQEEKAEKLLEYIGKNFKYDLKKMYEFVGIKAIDSYGGLHEFFQAIVKDGEKITNELNIETRLSKYLVEVVKDKIKPIEVSVGGTLIIKSSSNNGLEELKEILTGLEKNQIKVSYLGAPNYKIQAYAFDYKKAEQILNNAIESASKSSKKKQCEINFKKDD